MSTNCTVSYLIDDNNTNNCMAIYCHWDGYIDGVGKELIINYNSKELTQDLVAKGDHSSLVDGIAEPYTSQGEDFADIKPNIYSLEKLSVFHEYNYVFMYGNWYYHQEYNGLGYWKQLKIELEENFPNVQLPNVNKSGGFKRGNNPYKRLNIGADRNKKIPLRGLNESFNIARKISESIGFKRGSINPYTKLKLGDPSDWDKSGMQEFADKNGYEFSESGNPQNRFLEITIPLKYDEKHSYASVRKEGEIDYFSIQSIQYRINRPDGWEDSDTPISLRKRWMRNDKATKQTLMARFNNIDQAIDRIAKSIIRELKKAKEWGADPEYYEKKDVERLVRRQARWGY